MIKSLKNIGILNQLYIIYGTARVCKKDIKV